MRGGKREGAGRPRGTNKPESLTKMLTVRIHPNLFAKLQIMAKEKNMTLNQMVREYCEDIVSKEKSKDL